MTQPTVDQVVQHGVLAAQAAQARERAVRVQMDRAAAERPAAGSPGPAPAGPGE